MLRTLFARLRWVAAAAAVMVVPSFISAGEHMATFFFGSSTTSPLDFRVNRPGMGDDLLFHDSHWLGDSAGVPPLYGIRYMYYPDCCPSWGFGLDYLHNRAVADRNRPTQVTGTRAGVPINTVEPMRNTFDHLEFTDGLNSWDFNVVKRWQWTILQDRCWGTVQPYLGAGIGALFPSVETKFVNEPLYKRYEWRGPGFQVFTGVNIPVTKHFGVTLEYRYNYANLRVNILNGTQHSIMNSHTFLFGPTLRF